MTTLPLLRPANDSGGRFYDPIQLLRMPVVNDESTGKYYYGENGGIERNGTKKNPATRPVLITLLLP